MKKILFSIIIIDYKTQNPYLVECLSAIQKQTYSNFEIILLTDFPNKLVYPKMTKKSFGHYVGPAEKRDIGAKMARGEILAFIDDDAYPDKNWLKNILKNFQKSNVVGVGGPGVTPPGVSWQEEASGWASASPIGSGSYAYRFLADKKKRFVEDYPSMNLSVRKKDFLKVGGFDSNYWPGEDTKLCLDLISKTNKKIVYSPGALVYHHRRPILVPHLRQNGNFGLHRGFFARVLPKTSFKLIYFAPSALVVYHFLFPLFGNLNLLKVYFFLLFLNSIWILKKSKNLFQSILSFFTIYITHMWYGVRFLQGFIFTGKLKQ